MTTVFFVLPMSAFFYSAERNCAGVVACMSQRVKTLANRNCHCYGEMPPKMNGKASQFACDTCELSRGVTVHLSAVAGPSRRARQIH